MKIFKLTHVLGAALIGLASFSSCTDACKDVDCGTGTCIEGTCACPDGFSGTNCGTEDRAQFIGNFIMSGTIAASAGNVTFSDESMINTVSTSSATKFIMTLLGGDIVVTCTAGSGTNGFALDATTFDGCDYTGSGTITGANLSLTLNETCPDPVGSSVITITAIKQ
jgi:hypothetical protein